MAYDNLGHAYFFEDGNEVENTMQYNLGLVTRRPAKADALFNKLCSIDPKFSKSDGKNANIGPEEIGLMLLEELSTEIALIDFRKIFKEELPQF